MTAEDKFAVRYYRPRPEEEWHRHALLHESGKLKIDRRRFLTVVKAELAPVFGPGAPFSSKHKWRYDTPLGPWVFVTLVDVGGSVHQLSYSHTIQADVRRPLSQGLSICGWLGIGGGHTMWNQLTEADTPAAAQALARICAHFLPAVSAMVAGLTPDS